MCARSARRMLYVAAVGTLISTLNQAYKSSEVHVSMRMISEGRLLALTSSGIYIGALQLRRSSAAYRAVLSGAELAKIARLLVRIRAQYRHGRTVHNRCAHHWLDYASIFIRYITRPPWKSPFGNYCANTQTWEKRSTLGVYPSHCSHRVNLLYSQHS